MTKIKTSDIKLHKEQIASRLSRIEGQLRGIRRMLDEEKSCIDVVNQVMAAREAIGSIGLELLKNEFCERKEGQDLSEDYLKTLFKIR